MLAAALATFALGAPPAVADVGTTRTFASGALCKTGGEVTYDAGAITIDIGKLAPDVTDVVIATGALSGCLADVISLRWAGVHQLNKLTIGQSAFSQNNMPGTLTSVSFPAGLTSLEIGDIAFYQQAADGSTAPKGPNTLASVTFPEGLTSLRIGPNAFYQYATSGNNALASVVFPESLTSLSIGNYAFYQDADVGDNALKKVEIKGRMATLDIGQYAFYQTADIGNNALNSLSFPAGVDTITVGASTFGQRAPQGETALASVGFPSGLTTLVVGKEAFWQYVAASGTATLSVVRLPGSLTSLSVGTQAFHHEGLAHAMRLVIERTDPWTAPNSGVFSIDAAAFRSVPTWYWFGADGTSLASVWNGTFTAVPANPVLLGYRTLTLDAGAGTAPEVWYVYPVSHVLAHYPRPQVLERAVFGTAWSVNLPSATRAGYQLDGWCPVATSPCPTTPAAVGASYSLTEASQTQHAAWKLLPPVVVKSLPVATVGVSYQQTVATGAELACSVAGALPPGLSLGGCLLSGTPSLAGTYRFTVTVTNAAGSPGVPLTLVVHNKAPSIGAVALKSGKVTVPYSAGLAVTGVGVTCAVTAGSLPPGVALKSCALSGTPTKTGSYSFTVTARNDGGAASQKLTLTIAAAKKFTKVYQPTISGTAKVGKTLKAKVKTWKPKPTKLTWQWYRDGVAITGATKTSYKLTKADKGKKLTVRVTGTRVGYLSRAYSKKTAKVK